MFDPGNGRIGPVFLEVPPVTCVASPTKKNLKSRFSGQFHDWKHLYLRFLYGRRDSAITPVHHPAIESLVLSLQCGKATAVLVSSRDRQFVAQVGKRGSSCWICFFSYCGQVFFLLLLHRRAVLVRTSIFGVLKKKSRTM